MKRTCLVILILLVATAATLIIALRGSLATLDGERAIAGLNAPVIVTRDALGVPTVNGRTRTDVARATGYLHAQDRFFQMDLLRRVAAGELAALFGAVAVDVDRKRRVHGLRHVARTAVPTMSAFEQDVLAAYVDGVNAGLEQLAVVPPEYLLLRSTPQPWRAEDTVLAVHAMFLRLSDGNALAEMRKGLLFECLPEPVAAFLASPDPDWQATVDGGVIPAASMPAASDLDLRTLGELDFDTGRTVAQTLGLDPDLPGGASNAWVVSGTRTSSGHALVANDMHLSLRLPNIWYRMRLVVDGDTQPPVDMNGVTLPGAPAMVVGSNGQVAWGFTNSYGDWSDRIRLQLDPDDPDRYLTPDGPRAFGLREERIQVRGGDEVVSPVRETIWGPVLLDALKRPTALRWTAHRPEAVNLRLLEMEGVSNVTDALALAPHLGIPPQNFNVGDDAGHIGWTIAGRIPRRNHYDPSRPSDGAVSGQGWNGWLPPDEYPRIVDPPGGFIWTANHPVVTGEALTLIGDSGYAHGARARQIRDALRALDRATVADMLRIQLDDRALLLARWKSLLDSLLQQPAVASHPRATEFREALQRGDDRASAGSVGYRLVWTFRTRLRDVVFSAITAPCRALVADYRFEGFRQYEGPLWRLVTQRPAHLLHPGFADWDALLSQVATETLDHFDDRFEGPISERTWGEQNVLTMRHPLTRAVPALGSWLNLAPAPMSGDRNMPRVLAFDDGASQRLGVSPGHEAHGYLHMPGGQSGHFLSPYYSAGHDAWVHGEPLPLLPGARAHELRLVPDRADR